MCSDGGVIPISKDAEWIQMGQRSQPPQRACLQQRRPHALSLVLVYIVVSQHPNTASFSLSCMQTRPGRCRQPGTAPRGAILHAHSHAHAHAHTQCISLLTAWIARIAWIAPDRSDRSVHFPWIARIVWIVPDHSDRSDHFLWIARIAWIAPDHSDRSDHFLWIVRIARIVPITLIAQIIRL